MKRISTLLCLMGLLANIGLSQNNNEQDSLKALMRNYSSSLEKSVLDGDSLQVAQICYELGYIYLQNEEYELAMSYLQRANRLDRELGLDSALVMVYNREALLHRFKGEYPEAIIIYENAIQLAEKIGDTALVNRNKLSLGIIYKLQSNYEKALSIFMETLPYYERTSNLEILTPLGNCVGGIFYHKHEYNEALKHLNSALDASRALGLNMDVAANLKAIGLVYLDLGQYEVALQYEFEALQAYTDLGNKKDAGWVLVDIGDIYAAYGDFDQAMQQYDLSLAIAREIQDDESLSMVRMAMARTMIRYAGKSTLTVDSQWYSTAKGYLAESLNTALAMGQKENIMNIYNLLYQADSASGNLNAALNDFKRYTIYKDSINDIESKNRMAQLEYDFMRQQKEKEITALTEENEIKSTLIRKQRMQRNGILFTTGLFILTAALVFRSIQLRRKLERQQAISAERERISGDLHDDIGSGLSKIILMLEVLNKEAGTQEIKERTQAIAGESIELSKNMSSAIWALNSRYDSLESLVVFIRKYASEYLENSPVRFKMYTPEHYPEVYLSSEHRRNIYYAVKEALHNIVKHAHATLAQIKVSYENQVLTLTVKDNGCGLPEGELNRFGNGIILMKKRMESIGGSFSIENKDGTTITLSLPILKNRP